MNIVTDTYLYSNLRDVLQRGWISLPDSPGYRGTGAPGIMLEKLLGLDGRNYDTPDSGKWEIKFHSRSALLTLFHLEAQPKGHLHPIVLCFGWPDSKGRTSFRHTIRRRTERGFYIINENGCITVKNDQACDIEWPYWTHDSLINAFAAKFRRLIVVKGQKRGNRVRYQTAHLYWEPKITQLIEAIERGVIAIDFDARTTDGRGLRNHGTKFRIQYSDLYHLYHKRKEFS